MPVLHVLPHTHWDREWYEPLEVYRFQLVKMVDRLLEVLDTDSAFRHFTFDGQTAAIEDYLEVRSAVEPEVRRFVEEGRLSLGPWRILMDEFLCSAETIVRNLRQGTAMAKRLGGYMPIGYIPDSFGHVSQMPQILRLAGFTDACVWRGVPAAIDRSAFTWEAPDGSRVRAIYLARSYSNGASIPTTFEELMVRAKRIVEDMAPFEPGNVVLAMNGTDHRGPEAHLPALFADANTRQDELSFRIGSLPEFLADAPRDDLPVWRGEMRSGARANLLMGVVSARVPLKQLELAASTMLERYAEPLAAMAGTRAERLLAKPWRAMVENSAHDSICGCGIDAVADAVAARYREAHRVADLVAQDALETLVSRIDTGTLAEGDEGVAVFNPSPAPRRGLAEVAITLPAAPEEVAFRAPDGRILAAQPIEITDQVIVDMKLRGSELGRIVPSMHSRMLGPLYVNALDVEEGRPVTIRLRMGPLPVGSFDVEAAKRRVEELTRARPNGRFHVIGTGPPLCRMLIDSGEVGGTGWTTLMPIVSEAPITNRATASEHTISNEYLRAVVRDDGSVDVTHIETGLEYPGLLALRDGGDAGDEYNYSPPEHDSITDRPQSVDVSMMRAGPLDARLRVGMRWRLPAQLTPNRRARARRALATPISLDLTLRVGEPFLRAVFHVDNGARDHRLRAHFPLPFSSERSHADGAFDVVERSLQAEGGFERALPTFPCRRWVDVSDGRSGLAVLHAGTPEYELVSPTELSVTLLRSVGWLSRQDLAYRSGPAGPLLETPGAQLLGEHTLRLAVYPHAGDWSAARIPLIAESFGLPLRAAGVRRGEGELPNAGSAVELSPHVVVLSSLEEREGHVDCRLYNASSAHVEAVIRIGLPFTLDSPALVDLLGNPLRKLDESNGTITLPLKPHEIATVRLN